MGNRLTAIVTKTGDQGTTSLDGRTRCAKSDILIEVVGDLDELNSLVGVAISLSRQSVINDHPKWHAETLESLKAIQHDLFSIGGSVVLSSNLLEFERINALEKQIEQWLNVLSDLKDFILPGGSNASAHLHLARAVCRRVERGWWGAYSAAINQDPVHFSMMSGQYLNRLADWLFVAARLHNQMESYPETLWNNPTHSSSLPI